MKSIYRKNIITAFTAFLIAILCAIPALAAGTKADTKTDVLLSEEQQNKLEGYMEGIAEALIDSNQFPSKLPKTLRLSDVDPIGMREFMNWWAIPVAAASDSKIRSGITEAGFECSYVPKSIYAGLLVGWFGKGADKKLGRMELMQADNDIVVTYYETEGFGYYCRLSDFCMEEERLKATAIIALSEYWGYSTMPAGKFTVYFTADGPDASGGYLMDEMSFVEAGSVDRGWELTTCSGWDKTDIVNSIAETRRQYNKINEGIKSGEFKRTKFSKNGYQYLSTAYRAAPISVKTIVSTGDPMLDPIMAKSGFKNYSVEFYYDLLSDQESFPGTGLRFIYALIDGKEYRYYFILESYLRRIGPDKQPQDAPKINSFIRELYDAGCRCHGTWDYIAKDENLSLN
ncbi:MAG: hypothetical protein Q4E57_11460 [Eubacteriales bacterium]|nr:hypothetical protein [Eubacteriales bacterium]